MPASVTVIRSPVGRGAQQGNDGPNFVDLYLLVHPERYPSNDWDAVMGAYARDEFAREAIGALAGGFNNAYGAQVANMAGAAGCAVVLFDPSDVQGLIEDADVAGLLNSDQDQAEVSATRLCAEVCRRPGGEQLQVTVGAPLALFAAALEADPIDIGRVTGVLRAPHPHATARVGGFARGDCVARAARTLRRNGWQVHVCPLTTLPLDHTLYAYPPAR